MGGAAGMTVRNAKDARTDKCVKAAFPKAVLKIWVICGK